MLTQNCKGDYVERNKFGGSVTHMVDRRAIYKVLMGKPEGKRPLERPRCRWEDNIKMELKEVGCGARTASSCLRRGTGDGHLRM